MRIVNKIHGRYTVLHVSTPKCHLQAVCQNKDHQSNSPVQVLITLTIIIIIIIITKILKY